MIMLQEKIVVGVLQNKRKEPSLNYNYCSNMREVQPRLSDVQDSSDSRNDSPKAFWSQRLASFLLSLLMLSTGLANGWNSPYLARLMLEENVDGIPRATDDELTWLSTLMNFARLFGAVIGAVAQDTIGRKWSLYFAGVPMICGWISVTVAVNIQWLYAYRILCGLASGITATTHSHYLSEIADPKIRGSLILWNSACRGIGISVGNIMGAYLSMQTYAYIAIGLNLFFLGSFVIVPDSPYQYISVGNMDKAESSLKWFRRSDNVKNELVELQAFVNNSKATFKQRINELKQSKYRRSFLMMFMINVFVYFGASNVLTNYMEILITMSKVPVNASIVVAVIGFFCVIAALVATFLIDVFGRRRLMIFGSILNAVALTTLGLHFQLLNFGYSPADLVWLPCICLLLSTVSFHGGTGCVPSTLIGELFSPALKTIGSLCFSSTSAAFASLSTATFIPILNLVGPNYLFWFYACGLYISIVYYYLFLPETMGKSLKSIQDDIKK